MKRFFIIVAIITFSLGIVKTSLAQSMNGMPPQPSEGQDGGYVVPKIKLCCIAAHMVTTQIPIIKRVVLYPKNCAAVNIKNIIGKRTII